MKSDNINDLINKVKSNNEQNKIQKIVPVSIKEIEEIQFSFYIEKDLYKKLKLKAINEEISMKEIMNERLQDMSNNIAVKLHKSGLHPIIKYH